MWPPLQPSYWVTLCENVVSIRDIIASVFAAIVLVLLGAKAQSKRKAAKRKQQRAEDMLNSGISSNIEKGKQLMEAANLDKDRAVAAHAKMEAQLDKLGDRNEELDVIADRFNSKRLRSQPSRDS